MEVREKEGWPKLGVSWVREGRVGAAEGEGPTGADGRRRVVGLRAKGRKFICPDRTDRIGGDVAGPKGGPNDLNSTTSSDGGRGDQELLGAGKLGSWGGADEGGMEPTQRRAMAVKKGRIAACGRRGGVQPGRSTPLACTVSGVTWTILCKDADAGGRTGMTGPGPAADIET